MWTPECFSPQSPNSSLDSSQQEVQLQTNPNDTAQIIPAVGIEVLEPTPNNLQSFYLNLLQQQPQQQVHAKDHFNANAPQAQPQLQTNPNDTAQIIHAVGIEVLEPRTIDRRVVVPLKIKLPDPFKCWEKLQVKFKDEAPSYDKGKQNLFIQVGDYSDFHILSRKIMTDRGEGNQQYGFLLKRDYLMTETSTITIKVPKRNPNAKSYQLSIECILNGNDEVKGETRLFTIPEEPNIKFRAFHPNKVKCGTPFSIITEIFNPDGDEESEEVSLRISQQSGGCHLHGTIPDFGKEDKTLTASVIDSSNTLATYKGVQYSGDDDIKGIQPEESQSEQDDDPGDDGNKNTKKRRKYSEGGSGIKKKSKVNNSTTQRNVWHRDIDNSYSLNFTSSFCNSFMEDCEGLRNVDSIIEIAKEWIDKRDMYGRPITFYFVSEPEASVSLIHALFNECGYDVDEQDVFGSTCAHWAKHFGARQIYGLITFLCKADVEIKNCLGITASELEFDVDDVEDERYYLLFKRKDIIRYLKRNIAFDKLFTPSNRGITFHVDDIDAEFITRWDIHQGRVEIKAKVCEGDNNRYFVMGRHQKFEYNENNINYFAVTFRDGERFYRKLFRCEINHDKEFLSAETYVDTEWLYEALGIPRYKGERRLKLNYEMIEYDFDHDRCTRRINHKPADDLILLRDGKLIY
ncbi:hypothetical protein AKO1_010098 [Acrasis kona]|uniref:Uncharacterized protein n=1 Tax=Acrasis kona TaxID=1008807 RepID=A0AAW2ZRA2_9EUKA